MRRRCMLAMDVSRRNVLKKAQRNTSNPLAERKRTLSPSSGREDGGNAEKRRKLTISPKSSVQGSIFPADSVTSPPSFEKRSDESSDSPSTPSPKRGRIPKGKSSKRVIFPSTSDFKSLIQMKYKILKRHMEPTGIVEILHDRGILEDQTVDNVENGHSREIRNDILMKALCMQGNMNIFLSALKDTGQSKIAEELSSATNQNDRNLLKDYTTNEMKDMLMFAEQMEEILLEEVEPRRFIDDVVVTGGLSLQDHEDIISLPKRRQRCNLLLEKVRTADKSVTAVKIIQPMVDIYGDIYRTFKTDNNENRTKKQNDDLQYKESVAVGSPLQMKLQIIPSTTVAVQDSYEHDEPGTVLNKLKQEVKEIDRKIVDRVNENPEHLSDLFQACIAEFEKINVSCIKVYMKALSTGSLDKLRAYSRSGAVKRLILSMIDKETRYQLEDMHANVIVDVYRGRACDAESTKSGIDCLCRLDKETVTRNYTFLQKNMKDSRSIGARLLETDLVDERIKTLLKDVMIIKDTEETNKQLLHVFLQNDLPKVWFCILEEEIIKHGGRDVILNLKKDESAAEQTKVSMSLNRDDIKRNMVLLKQELEPRWFIQHLKKNKDPVTERLIETMLESRSRKERLTPFLDYLLSNKHLVWFSDALGTIDKQLLLTLLNRKASTFGRLFSNIDIARVYTATRLSIDDIIEEVDPLMLLERLPEREQQELHLSALKSVPERRKRATRFSLSLLAASPSTFCATLYAMLECGYKDIVDEIVNLAKEGPCNGRYKCANIQYCLDKGKVFRTKFSLGGHCDVLKAETPIVAGMKDVSERTSMNVQSSPVRFKLLGDNLKDSFKGSAESGVFSGLSTDAESDYRNRSSMIYKRPMTKEWIEKHSKPVLKAKTPIVAGMKDVSERTSMNVQSSPVRFKLLGDNLKDSFKGSAESGVFSGLSTDAESDYRNRSSMIYKRPMTKEWIENHSKPAPFISSRPIVGSALATCGNALSSSPSVSTGIAAFGKALSSSSTVGTSFAGFGKALSMFQARFLPAQKHGSFSPEQKQKHLHKK